MDDCVNGIYEGTINSNRTFLRRSYCYQPRGPCLSEIKRMGETVLQREKFTKAKA